MSATAAAGMTQGTEQERPSADAWRLLPSMEVHEPARRWADGSVSVLLLIPARTFLYGPFLRLAQGRYRISFRCGVRMPLQGDHPVLGLEVVAQNRILCAWRDFTAADLRSGEQSVTFDVPSDLSIEGGADAPFEFRYSHFGNAWLTMLDVTLHSEAPGDPADSQPAAIEAWRLLGRLRTLPRPGGVSLSPVSINWLKLGRSSATLRLPMGTYRVDLACDLKGARRQADPALEIAVRTRDGTPLGLGRFNASDLAKGHVSFEFGVPMDLSMDVGVPRAIDFRIRHFRNASLLLRSFDLHRLSPQVVVPSMLERDQPRLAYHPTKKRIVIFGNCQGNLLAEALRDHSGFSRQFSVKHHYMELPAYLHEQGRRDLEECDMLLIQDIREWEQYPLRDYVPEQLPTLRYPCVRFASLWPFDAFNGPDDKLARNRDFPNFEFTYFDGLLARLRKELPDHERRFKAYESLQIERVVDFKRLHTFEERRLEEMDRKFTVGIGAYILDNFRNRQVFYTTAHPNGAIMKMLVKHVTRELGLSLHFWLPGSLNSLRRLQVPVHPKVAAALGVKWADAQRTYLVRGEWITWEEYVRKYISYYG
ncbi:WcbI family polysaccharide biosynthesis putative acetyltransferase [Bosea vaviloviae]|uniref:Polysaccharide biosynthesis enzyme WcbI domain-containing protein n=1 Tax=Bosea vaviloviae TaxID=1526658 RepID=A0A1D7U7R3_9HYPH|nr:WcbI family polysaccharide biosynthesis putative acetyltransferase [Bosea vaviloviae]AOO83420.1 hypothetical protein BHK69_25915 [Bosea vaviloviae]